ncbi:MAG: NAD(P)-dependent alcohol dehydrogenase [Janthinobacterium lividum]
MNPDDTECVAGVSDDAHALATDRDTRAAVVRQVGGPFILEQCRIDAPRADEILIRMVATGMCHTDIVVRDQLIPTPLPVVLGHEGAGVVEAVGVDVRKVVPGDHVVLTFLSCGRCFSCQTRNPASCENFYALNFAGHREDGSHGVHADVSDRFFGQSSFATFALAHERNVVKVRSDVPLELLGPLGCGIQTGAGTVLNALKVAAGARFVAFGAGAVGLSAVMAARIAGATTIVAVDRVPARLALARELGATHVIDARSVDAVAAIREITGGGADYTMDSTGRVDVIRQAVDALRPGGECAIVGASAIGAELRLDVNELMAQRKSIRGVVEGASCPDFFIPHLIELYVQGRFPFDKLVRFYEFDQINQAAADSENGLAIKPVIRIR